MFVYGEGCGVDGRGGDLGMERIVSGTERFEIGDAADTDERDEYRKGDERILPQDAARTRLAKFLYV